MLAAEPRVLRSEHPGTLLTAGNLAGTLSDPERDVNADQTHARRCSTAARVQGIAIGCFAVHGRALTCTCISTHGQHAAGGHESLAAGRTQLAVWSQRPRARRSRLWFGAPTFCRTHCRSKQSAVGFAVDNGCSNARNNKQISLSPLSLLLNLFSLSVCLSLCLSLSLSRALPDHCLSSWFTSRPWPWPLQRVPERVVLPTL